MNAVAYDPIQDARNQYTRQLKAARQRQTAADSERSAGIAEKEVAKFTAVLAGLDALEDSSRMRELIAAWDEVDRYVEVAIREVPLTVAVLDGHVEEEEIDRYRSAVAALRAEVETRDAATHLRERDSEPDSQ